MNDSDSLTDRDSAWGGGDEIGFATVREGGSESSSSSTSSSGLSEDEDTNLSNLSADEVDVSYPEELEDVLPFDEEADSNFFLSPVDLTSLTKQIVEIREIKVRKSHLLILDSRNRVFFIPPKRNGKIYSVPENTKAKHIFFAPNTYHALLTIENGDVYYINTFLGSYKPRKLKTLRGIKISAVRWDGLPKGIGSEKDTGILLIGTEDSKLFQYELTIDPERKRKRKSVPFRMLLDFHADKILYNTGNTSIGRISDIVVRPCSRGRKIFILVTTPNIIFEFDGPLSYDLVFEKYRNQTDFVLKYKEIPTGQEKCNELHVFGKGFAWLCSRGIYHGKLIEGVSQESPHLGESEMIVIDDKSRKKGIKESKQKEIGIDNDNTDNNSTSTSNSINSKSTSNVSAFDPSRIISIAINQYHIFVLHEKKFVVYLQPSSLVSIGDSGKNKVSRGGLTVRGVTSKSQASSKRRKKNKSFLGTPVLRKQMMKIKSKNRKINSNSSNRQRKNPNSKNYEEEEEEEDIKGMDDSSDDEYDDDEDDDHGMNQIPISKIMKMFEYKFNKGHGTPVKLEMDGGDVYCYTDSKLWKLEIEDIQKDVWKFYLDYAVKNGVEDMFDESLKLIGEEDLRKKDTILIEKADYLFNKSPKPDFDRAVKLYAQTSRPFESVALKLYFQEDKKHLITFLTHKLKVIEEHTKMEDNRYGAKTQISCIIVWTVELFINLLNDYSQTSKDDGMLGNPNDKKEDEEENNNTDSKNDKKFSSEYDSEELERKKKLNARRMKYRRGGIRLQSTSELNLVDDKKEKKFKDTKFEFEEFLKAHKKHLQPIQSTLFFLLSSHCRIEELIFLATLVKSYEHVLDAYITAGQYLNCLEYLKEHCCGKNNLLPYYKRKKIKKSEEEKQEDLKFAHLWYKYIPKLLNYDRAANSTNNLSPQKIIKTLKSKGIYFVTHILQPGRFLPCLMKFTNLTGNEDLVLEYLEFVIRELENKEICVHNLMVFLLAKKSEKLEKDGIVNQSILNISLNEFSTSSSKINNKKSTGKKKVQKAIPKIAKQKKKSKRKTIVHKNDEESSGLSDISEEENSEEEENEQKKKREEEEEADKENDGEEEEEDVVKTPVDYSQSEEESNSSSSENSEETEEERRKKLQKRKRELLKSYERNLLHFLMESKDYDYSYGLRVCLQFHRVHSSIFLCKKLKLYPIAIEFALNEGLIDEAKSIASQVSSSQDKDIKKNSWLRILKHIVEQTQKKKKEIEEYGKDEEQEQQHEYVEKAVEMLKELNDQNNDLDLKLEDILDFFPEDLELEVFKKEICSNLDKYKTDIENLKRNMLQKSKDADILRMDIKRLKHRSVYLHPKTSNCDHCNQRIIIYEDPRKMTDFFLFPCAHKFHSKCLLEVVFSLSEEKKQKIRSIINNSRNSKNSNNSGFLTGDVNLEIDNILTEECPFCGIMVVDSLMEMFFITDEEKKLQISEVQNKKKEPREKKIFENFTRDKNQLNPNEIVPSGSLSTAKMLNRQIQKNKISKSQSLHQPNFRRQQKLLGEEDDDEAEILKKLKDENFKFDLKPGQIDLDDPSWKIILKRADYFGRKRDGKVGESTDEDDETRILELDIEDLSSDEIKEEKERIQQNKVIKKMKSLTSTKRYTVETNI